MNRKAIEELRLRLFPAGTILFPKSGASTFLNHRVVLGEPAYVSSHLACIICDETKAVPKYVYSLLCHVDAREITPDQAYPSLRLTEISNIEIPLPPLEVQKEIMAETEGYQKIIDGARAVLDNYRPHIPIHPEWPTEQFSSVTSTITPPKKIQKADFKQLGRYPVIDQSQVAVAGRTDDEDALVDASGGLVIFGDHTCAVKFVDKPFAQGADGIKIIKAGERLLPKFVYFFLLGHPIEQEGYKRHFGKLNESLIAIPPIEVQQQIIDEIEAEQALINANRELIERMEKKIQVTLARIWGEDEPALKEA